MKKLVKNVRQERILGKKVVVMEDKPNAKDNILLKPLEKGKEKALLYWDALEQRIDILFLKSKIEFDNSPACSIIEKKIGKKKYYGFSASSVCKAGELNLFLSEQFKILA